MSNAGLSIGSSPYRETFTMELRPVAVRRSDVELFDHARLYHGELLKKVLSPLLLAPLAHRESYGYELVARLRKQGLPCLSESRPARWT